MAKCPHCHRYQFTFIDKWKMNYYMPHKYPSRCPECQGLYMSSYAARLKLVFLIVIFAILSVLLFKTFQIQSDLAKVASLVIIVAVSLVLRAAWENPIAHTTHSIIGNRPIWQNAVVFVVLPILVFSVLFWLIVQSGVVG